MFYMTYVPVSGMQSEPTPTCQPVMLDKATSPAINTLQVLCIGKKRERFALLLSPQRLHSDHAAPESHNNTLSS